MQLVQVEQTVGRTADLVFEASGDRHFVIDCDSVTTVAEVVRTLRTDEDLARAPHLFVTFDGVRVPDHCYVLEVGCHKPWRVCTPFEGQTAVLDSDDDDDVRVGGTSSSGRSSSAATLSPANPVQPVKSEGSHSGRVVPQHLGPSVTPPVWRLLFGGHLFWCTG